MNKHSANSRLLWHFTVSAIAVSIALTVNTANASKREEAINALTLLHQASLAMAMPEELKSVDATFSYAEDFYKNNYPEIAERYYLLTIQKARILETSLASRIPGTQPPSLDRQAIPPGTDQTATASLENNQHSALLPSYPTPVSPFDAVVPNTGPPSLSPEKNTTADISSENAEDNFTSDTMIGNANFYTVVKNDVLRLVAAKLGVSRQHLIQANNLDSKATLKIGQKLKYNNRKIVPLRMKNGIVINIPDRTLYYFRNGKLTVSLPVALGTGKKSYKYDWKTPTGKFRITAKQKDPTWYVPQSIQSEMEEGGKEVITSIPPGPTNPLGKYAIKTSIPGILIHSTTKPGSIYSFSSHGCIRIYPEHMEEFFKEIKINTRGEIIYRPVKLAVTENGRVFLEVHQDAYGKSSGLYDEARLLIEKQKLSGRVDWKKVESIIKQKAGLAEDVSL